MPNNDRFQIQPPQPEEEQLQGPQLGGFLPFLGRQAVRGVSRAVTSPFEFLEALGGIGTSLGERAESAAQQLTGLKPTEIEQEQIPMGITLPKLFGLTPKQPSDISPITAFSKIAQEVGRLGQKPFEKAKEVLPEGYLDPQNLGERIFDRVASAAPILAAAAISGGGGFFNSIFTWIRT